MNHVLSLSLLAAFGLILVTGATPAQIKQGDLVLTSSTSGQTGIFYTTWSGSLRTLRSGITLNAVKMSYANNYALAVGTSSGNVYRFTGTGSHNTLTTMTTSGTAAIAVDQDGTHMVVNYTTGRLQRISGSSATTWLTLSPSTHGRPNAICRDGNTGDWIVGTVKDLATGYLLRIDRSSRSITTLGNVGPVYGVDWIPQTGQFVVARAMATRQYLSWVSNTGNIARSIALPAPNCVTVCHKTGRVFTATSHGRVYGYTYAGGSLGYRYYGVNRVFTGIDCYQDENVTLSTYASPKVVRVYLRFWESPGRPYYVALSFAPTGGIRLSTYNWVNVRPDTLFFLTAAGGLPYFTNRFVGTLTNSGYGYAYFVMPYTGAPVYVTAVAVNPAKPDGLDVGNVAVVDSW